MARRLRRRRLLGKHEPPERSAPPLATHYGQRVELSAEDTGKFEYAEHLCRRGDVRALIEMLQSDSAIDRYAAVTSLARSEAPSASARLLETMRDDDALMR